MHYGQGALAGGIRGAMALYGVFGARLRTLCLPRSGEW